MDAKTWQRLCLSGRIARLVVIGVIATMLSAAALFGLLWRHDVRGVLARKDAVVAVAMRRETDAYARMLAEAVVHAGRFERLVASSPDLLGAAIYDDQGNQLARFGATVLQAAPGEMLATKGVTGARPMTVKLRLDISAATDEQSLEASDGWIQLAIAAGASLLLTLLASYVAIGGTLFVCRELLADPVEEIRAAIERIVTGDTRTVVRLRGAPEFHWIAVALNRLRRAEAKRREGGQASARPVER